jgi:hypothetical protein
LGLPTNLKKKIKYTEIDCTSHHSFLRVRRDQFLPNCKKTHPTTHFFYTDGSFIDGSTGFAFHRTGEGGFGYNISSPAGIFSAELTVLFVTLRHIGEVIQPPEKCLILTDSLSSVKALLSREISHRTHPLVWRMELRLE